MAEYTVKDDQTGKEITFEWNEDREPTQADMSVIFDEAHQQNPTESIDPYQNLPQGMSGTQKFLTGAGHGMYNLGLGALQRALEAKQYFAGSPENQANIYQLRQKKVDTDQILKSLYDQSTAANVGNFVGNVAPVLPMPGGVAGGFAKRAATSALAGGGVGLLQPTTQENEALGNAGMGAAFGAGGSLGMSGVGKVYNTIKSKNPALYQAIMDKYGQVRQTLGEVSNSPFIQKAETWLESMPSVLGISSFRRKQHEEAAQLVRNHFTQYAIDPSLETTALIKESNNRYINNLYSKFKESFKELPSGQATNTRQVTAEMLDEYPDVFKSFQNVKLKKKLEDIFRDTGGKNAARVTNTGKIDFQQGVTIDDLWELRKAIGKEISSAKDDIAKSQYRKLFGAVDGDLETLLSQGKGDAVVAFREANNAYKQYNVKFKAMREAYDKAMGTVGAKEMFSPKTYATALKNIANDPKKYPNIKWSPDEIDNMVGVANVLQVVKRSGKFMEDPPTGARWGIPQLAAITGGGAYTVGAPATAKIGGAILVTKFLTTTEAGKKLALAASKIEPNNPNMKVIVKIIMNQLPKVAATGATRDF
jgi:hypothetical protein